MPDTEVKVIGRDKRIDQIGFCGELVKRHGDVLKTAVKVRMLDEERDRVRGNYFEGLLKIYTPQSVDIGRFLKLWERGKITRAQVVSVLSVNRDKAMEFLSRSDLAEVSSEKPEVQALTVTRIKDVPLELVDALRGLNEQLAG